MATPMRDVRRLPFSSQSTERTPAGSRRTSLRQSFVPPSPYTPFSGRRSGSVPPGTPQLESDGAFGGTTPRGQKRDERIVNAAGDGTAEEFVRSGLDNAMRAASASTLSVLSKGAVHELPEHLLVDAMTTAIHEQILRAEALSADRTAHTHVRRELDSVLAALRAEEASWALLRAVWRPSEIRPADLTATRLSPDVTDSILISGAPGVRKAHLVAQWLEAQAADELDRAGGPRVKPLDDPAYRCAYTAQLKGVRAVSMDFALREEPLDETETKADERLCRELFRLLRAGRLSDAERICRAAGQPWRAAILAGGKRCSAHAANGRRRAGRAAWRNAVGKIARASAALPPHERALYGLLAGVTEPALAVATDYESRAWVRITTALDAACECALSGTPEGAAIPDEAILQMFRECEGAGIGHSGIPAEVHARLREVRAYFALGNNMSPENLEKLIEALQGLARAGSEHQLEWVCRLAAHKCLFLKLTEMTSAVEENEEVMVNFEDAVAMYPKLVILKDKLEEQKAEQIGAIRKARVLVSELAARELSILGNPTLIVDVYASLMISALIEDLKHEENEGKRVGVPHRKILERRTVCLEKAGNSLDRETLDMLVVSVVQQIWESCMPGDPLEDVNFEDKVTKEDELVIRSLEFLMFPAFANFEQAVLRAACAARKFFLAGKKQAARQLVNWFPKDALAQLPPDAPMLATRELDAWRMYMEALSQYDEWRTFYFSLRPIDLPPVIRDAAVARSGHVSYEVQAAANVQVDKYNAEMETYNRTSAQLRDAAVEALRTTLQYDGGWMRPHDGQDEEALREEDTDAYWERREEIEQIRRVAVPQLVTLLHSVLHESKLYSEAAELATTIADEATKLYECFGKADLKALLQRIADSSVLLADMAVKESGAVRPYKGYYFEEFA